MFGRASSMMPLRAAQRVSARTASPMQIRRASGHGPSYNEPSGMFRRLGSNDAQDTSLVKRYLHRLY